MKEQEDAPGCAARGVFFAGWGYPPPRGGFEKKGGRLQEKDVGPGGGLALGQDCGFGHDLRAGLFGQALDGAQAFAGADHVVHNGHALAADGQRVLAVQAEGLGLLGGDGGHLVDQGLGHVGLYALAGHDVIGQAQKAAELVHQGDALCLGGEEIIHRRQLGGEGLGGGRYQFLVAQDHKACNGQLRRELDDGKLAHDAGHVKFIAFRHKKRSFY